MSTKSDEPSQCIKNISHLSPKIHTSPLIINSFASILTAAHTPTDPKPPTPLLRNRTQIRIMRQIFTQQTSLGPHALSRGLLARNWTILQNLHKRVQDTQRKDIPWLSKVIRAVWTYSHSLWLDRCKHVHSTEANLNHTELQVIIRKYLQIDQKDLSADEKKIHLNVAQNMKFAHRKTLARWLELLRTECESTLRKKGTYGKREA